MKKLFFILVFIFTVQNINAQELEYGNKNELQEPYNPFLDCDINDSSCFQNSVNQHILNNFQYPQLANYFDIQAMVYVNYTIDKNGIVKNVSSNAALIGVAFEDVDSKKIISDAFEKAANSIIESLPKLILQL